MLQANDIAPRNPQPLDSQGIAPPTSSGKRKHSIVKDESDCESEDEGKREKALLVCFRFIMVNLQILMLSIC
jgi:hypothetical protein